MYLRRLAVPVAVIATGAAFFTAGASAATAQPAPTAPTAHGSTLAAGATVAPFRTFSSPASKSVRLRKPAATLVKSRTATGQTIYADVYRNCTTETGDGSQANPYCNLQDAVNAAVSGDTVDALGDGNGYFMNTLTVATSGISIVGVGGQNPGIFPELGNGGKPALVIDGASNVTISNLFMSAFNAPAVEVMGSSNLTFDSDSVTEAGFGSADTFTIDGSSSDVTVSRTFLDNGTWTAPGHAAVSIAAGASGVTLATDAISATGIKATGVNGLNVVGNTIERACAGGIDVEGASSGVYLENNLLEDANNQTDGGYSGGEISQCTANNLPWSPSITVSADSSTHTTADYNAFHSYGTDDTEPYAWAGTGYATLAAFRSAVGQGAHDAVDTTEPMWVYFPDAGWPMDARPITGSTAINSANAGAPGQLSSDFYGVSPYTTRGAIQYIPTDPTLAVSLSAANTSALGISFKTNITNGNVTVYLTVDYGDGTTYNTYFTGNYAYADSHVYARAGTYPISVTADDHMGDIVTNSVTVTTAGSNYTAYGPVRVLDTRKGIGTGGTVAKLGSDSTLKLKIAGAGTTGDTIPTGISAVVLNLTVTHPTAGGYLTAYPNQGYGGVPQTRPTVSNVNFSPGQSVPNLAIVPVGPDGVVDLYNGSGGTVDVIADVSGYFSQTTAAGYYSMDPYRLVDTRKGVGAPQAQVSANGSISVQIDGADRGELPTSGVTAVALNVTAVNAKAGGYLTVYPDGTTRPTASNLNFSAGQVIANAVIVPVGTDGKIRVFNGSSGGTDVLVDLVGYYNANGGAAYLPNTPVRVLDTRTWKYGPLVPGSYDYHWSNLSTTDHNVTAFVFNTTMTNTRGSGYETVSPDPNSLQAYQGGWAMWPTPPNVSTLNWTQGQVVPNLVQASTGSYGIVDFWNRSGGNTDLVVDQFGFYQGD
ncbi:right-handed parallel beta-helix repeat-containing protein [Actinocrinis puniceicyclus]|uniref:Right-handed parallel beta-helix repeat-containing protein n=1 Tax=Actinocrinis puniceicyclus TaxID=977794 RepID=A0A8J8BE26_9ACTN|nr:right-handed parallel beta-helix repeat-containing protein [Actinocrinis puniceicyclus]MBS2965095.1 right-handed parallel beta-helix repeat-containing protein [Actinocrinis puniceicyclus]